MCLFDWYSRSSGIQYASVFLCNWQRFLTCFTLQAMLPWIYFDAPGSLEKTQVYTGVIKSRQVASGYLSSPCFSTNVLQSGLGAVPRVWSSKGIRFDTPAPSPSWTSTRVTCDCLLAFIQ